MIAPTGASSTSASLASEVTGLELGRDAFLRLLVTQIQMQDPLEPLKAQDFIAQLAQFSSVEQLESANLQLGILQHSEATSQALLLIGRSIATGEGGISGVVEAVVFADGQPKLLVGGEQVNPGDVTRVW
jgi:flagellar basal-body rod modification protein FlgD